MSIKFGQAVIAVLILVAGFAYLGPQSSIAQSEEVDKLEALTDKIGLCVLTYGPVSCAQAYRAGEWAKGVTHDWKFKGSLDGDMGNSFRHCIWIGALTTWVGGEVAYGIGVIYEQESPKNPHSHRSMDEQNNYEGVQIGKDAIQSGISDTWGYVIEACESRAREGSLYGPCRILGGYLPHKELDFSCDS